jgi:uracil phosphoribosyltransferase
MLLPREGSPNTSSLKLPKIQLVEVEIQIRYPFLIHATEKGAAKLLMTPTRDANMQGPALQDAHRRVGTYLATEFLTDVIGLEGHLVPHVQEGKSATGYRLLSEDKTLIVALMRGGLPMAEGVNEVIPRAEILHAKDPDDVRVNYLTSRSAVVLVDAVINEGATVTKFVKHIRRLNATTRIVVVAGVIQAQSVREDGSLRTLARKHGKMNIIALRLSENKYTGSGTTDTGNRLFNSTYLQ